MGLRTLNAQENASSRVATIEETFATRRNHALGMLAGPWFAKIPNSLSILKSHAVRVKSFQTQSSMGHLWIDKIRYQGEWAP
jgi:hypothetical protein